MRPSFRLACCIAAALGFSMAAYHFAPNEERGVWKGYRFLLVEERIPEPQVLELLSKQGIREVISESTQPIEISDFKGIVTIELSRARSRLVTGDPRRDAYIDGLSRWYHASFSGKDYRIYYLRSGQGQLSARRSAEIIKALGGAAFFPEATSASGPSFLGLAIYLACCFALACLSATGRKRRSVAFSLIPGILLSLKGPEALAIAMLWAVALAQIIPGAALALAEYRRSGKKKRSCSIFGSSLVGGFVPLLTLLCLLGFMPSFIPAFCFALLASFSSFLAAWLAEELIIGRDGLNEGFIPVMILGKKAWRPWADSSLRMCWWGEGICFVALAILCLGIAQPAGSGRKVTANQGESLLLPHPQALAGFPSHPAPPAAELLVTSHKDGELVDISDWLVHRWREEALFYLPLESDGEAKPFSELAVPASESSHVVRRSFGPAWASASYRSMHRGGVETLLSTEGSFLRAVEAPVESKNTEPLAPIEPILYIILLAPSLVGSFFLWKDKTTIRRGHGKAT